MARPPARAAADRLTAFERDPPSEHPGEYTIVVQKPGYRELRVAGVEVEAGRCHVETRTIEARLVPIT